MTVAGSAAVCGPWGVNPAGEPTAANPVRERVTARLDQALSELALVGHASGTALATGVLAADVVRTSSQRPNTQSGTSWRARLAMITSS